ncbi:MAG: long-chain fatty acid--CoA ligase [Bradymonadales bacterium]|nr:MAG: long-chain fatty acid--CoA ligase [Bradymonadales bacterium]
MTNFIDPIGVLKKRALESPDAKAYGYQSFGGKSFESFQEMTWSEVWAWVQAYAFALESRGLQASQCIALQGRNQVDWVLIDFAILLSGGVSVPLFPQISSRERDYILKETGLQFFVTDQPQELQGVQLIGFHELHREARAQLGKAYSRKEPDFEAVATIVYTSGTTGEPKGVMHSLKNIGLALELGRESLGISERDRLISYLPLSHVAERVLSEFGSIYSGASVYFVDQVEKVVGALPKVKPTIFFAVPRVWNLILQRIEKEVKHNPLVQKRLQAIPKIFRSFLIPFLVKRKLGFQKVRGFFSGAAKLNPDVASNLVEYGIRVRECYGLTETLCLTTVAEKNPKSFGCVGRSYPGVDLRVAEDGEICAKADFHFMGYYKKPEATQEVLRNGWFHTGDVGVLDNEGRLRITDRKKDLFKGSNGKYVAPQPIEAQLRAVVGVQEAMVVGEEKAFCVALLSIQDGFEPSHFLSAVDRINRSLSPHERLKHIGLLPKAWTVEGGELTPSMKLKRKVIESRYQNEISELYNCREKALYFGEAPNPAEAFERKNCAHSGV